MLVKENFVNNLTSTIKGSHKYAYLGFNISKYKGQTISFRLNRKVINGETPTFAILVYNVTKPGSEKYFTLNNTDVVRLSNIEIPDIDGDLLLLTYNGIPGNTLGIDVEYSSPYLCIGKTLPDIYIPAKTDLPSNQQAYYPTDGNYNEIKAI